MTEKRILVPLDGSSESEAALPYASAIALAVGAKLRLISVIDTQFAYLFTGSDRPVVDWTERQRTQASEYLDRQTNGLRERGVGASSTVRLGNVSDEILREADDSAAMMVVTATHGRGGLQRWALGSVADKVMRLGHRPTLLIRPPAESAAPEVRLERLAVPLDGSFTAEQALPLSVELAQASGAELLLMRAEAWLTTQIARWGGGEGAYIPDLGEIEEETSRNAQIYLDEIRSRLPAAVRCQTAVLRGFPVEELESCCKQRHVNVVVMTTHGRGGLSRVVLGSTADRFVRDGIPALLIPPTAPEA